MQAAALRRRRVQRVEDVKVLVGRVSRMKCQAEQAPFITVIVHAVCDIEERSIEQLSIFIDADLAKLFYDEQSSTAIICRLDIDRPVESAGDIAPFVEKWDGECRGVDGSFSSR